MKSDLNTSVNTDASESSLAIYINAMQFTGLEFKAHFQTSQFLLYLYLLSLLPGENKGRVKRI